MNEHHHHQIATSSRCYGELILLQGGLETTGRAGDLVDEIVDPRLDIDDLIEIVALETGGKEVEGQIGDNKASAVPSALLGHHHEAVDEAPVNGALHKLPHPLRIAAGIRGVHCAIFGCESDLKSH